MNRVVSLTQAYSQTPWRKQVQMLALICVLLVIVAIAATVYLTVTAQANQYGRQIQSGLYEIRQLDIEISDLQAKYAHMTSASEMVNRALALGFQRPDSETVLYFTAPGYIPRQAAQISSASSTPIISAKFLPPQYTESVLVWLGRYMEKFTMSFLFEVNP